ncbi:MAG: TIR domain-containing protein [Clostridiales bacterium]|nr:TIR domain-containing protein [Clostridiales bacterium]
MEYTYKAFISYRHLPLDKRIADRLQKMLEKYKIPKNLGKREKWRVFRDETELPTSSDLSGDIKTALENSEFLIVICSKALKKSRWCMEEIAYFKELHGGSNKNIITLLVEGSPEESFPRELCVSAVETIGENGNVIKKEVEVEPLAANISGLPEKQALKKLKQEFLRIAAPLIGCGYDDLYNRDRRRKIKSAGAAVAAAFVLVTAFGLYNTAVRMELAEKNAELEEQLAIINSQGQQLNKQNNELDQKNEELENKNSELSQSNENLQKKTEEAEENLAEANIQRALAEQNQSEAESQREIAEQNRAEAETQRGIAEENLSLLTESNSELLIKAAASATTNAETLFKKGDRIGAIKTALSVRPYADDETKLLPATKKILASALYAYNTSSNPVADRILETDTPVKFYKYNDQGTAIYAYDSDHTIYIWDAETGKTLLKTSVGESISAFYSLEDEYSFCVVTSSGIAAFSLSEGKILWYTTGDYSLLNNTFISDDGSTLAVINRETIRYDDDINIFDRMFGENTEKTHYGSWFTACFIDTKTGTIIYKDTVEADASDDKDFSYFTDCGDFYKNSKFILSCYVHLPDSIYEYNTKFLYFDIENKSSSVIINECSLNPYDLCFYNSQKFAVVGICYNADNDISIRQVKDIDLSGNELFSIDLDNSLHPNNLCYMEWEDENLRLFVLCDYDTLILIDADSGKEYDAKEMASNIKSIYKANTTPGNPGIYVLYEYGRVTYLINDNTTILGSFLIESEDNYGSNGLIYDGKESYAALEEDNSVIILYKEINSESYVFEGVNSLSLTLSPDGRYFFCSDSYILDSSGYKTGIYDSETKKLLSTIPVYYNDCVFNGDCVVYEDDNTAVWYNIYTGKEEKSINLKEASDNDLGTSITIKPSQDGSTLFYSGSNFIYKPGDKVTKLIPDNNTYLSYVYRGDAESKTVTKEEKYSYPVLYEYRVNGDGSKIAAEISISSYDDKGGHYLYLMDTNTGESIPLIEGRSDSILSLSTKDGEDFAFGDNGRAALYIDNSVIIYNTDNGSVINTIQLGGISLKKMIFSPNSKYLFVYSNSSVLYKYDIESGEEEGRLTSFKGKADTSAAYPKMYINRQTNELIVRISWYYTAFVDIDMTEISLELGEGFYGCIEPTQELVFAFYKINFFPYYNSKQLIEMANEVIGET